MEPIRLTNERLLNELIFERSDLFDWLKLQARRGVVTAQVNRLSQKQSNDFLYKKLLLAKIRNSIFGRWTWRCTKSRSRC